MRFHLLSFFSFLKKKPLPNKEDFELLQDSPLSKSKFFLILSIFLSAILFLHILIYASAMFSQEVPDYGGTIVEGVIGAPKYINPLLAVTETDQLLTSLVYAGLMKKTDNDSLETYLADSCEIDPSGKSYQCTLSESTVFSNKQALSSEDVVFTFETKKNLVLVKDPSSDWSSTTATALDLRTVVIKTTSSADSLKQKMTLGIVPKSLWSSVPLERLEDSILNMKPIGSGPFVLEKTKIVNTIPTEIVLRANPKWHGQKPFINELIVRSYANQLDLKSGLKNGDINSTSALRGTFIDDSIKDKFSIITIPSKKNVGLYINTKEIGSKSEKVLKGLNSLIDKKTIIATIENGYGLLPFSSDETPAVINQELQITIAVQKDADMISVAELLSTNLRDFGIISTINVFDQGLFIDQINLGQYSFVLGTNIDSVRGYQSIIPIYNKSIIQINNKDIHVRTPISIESPHESLREVILWYKNTDFVWKWFIDKK